jgi:hypothetical protein
MPRWHTTVRRKNIKGNLPALTLQTLTGTDDNTDGHGLFTAENTKNAEEK